MKKSFKLKCADMNSDLYHDAGLLATKAAKYGINACFENYDTERKSFSIVIDLDTLPSDLIAFEFLKSNLDNYDIEEIETETA